MPCAAAWRTAARRPSCAWPAAGCATGCSGARAPTSTSWSTASRSCSTPTPSSAACWRCATHTTNQGPPVAPR